MAEQSTTDRSSGSGAHGAREATLADRLRYRFDSTLARGAHVVMAWLGLATLLLAVAATALVQLTGLSGVSGKEHLALGDVFWESVMRVLGRGAAASDAGWATRAFGFVMLVIGLLIGGALIALISTAVRERIVALRKGRSFVVEHGHTVILGWTPRVAGIIDELVLANESTSAAVVVLADVDPAQMHDRIAGRVGDLRTTRLVCRNGQPSEPADLHLVNITRARSIVVVGGNDPGVVKTLLAIRSSGATAPVVAEIDDARTARTVEDLFDGRVAIVSGQTVIANLTAQACRQPGLSQVFRELLDFDGDEIYLAPFPSLVGRTYGEAQLAFERSTVLGLMSERGIELNPPASTVITAGTEVIAIADDDSRYAADRNVGAPAAAVGSVSVDQRDAAGVPRRTVLVGWNPLGPRVVAELGKFAAAGSRLTVLVDPSIVDVEAVRGAAVSARLDVRVEASGGAPEDLVAVAAAEPFDEVIVLSRRGAASTEAADAESLLVLLAFAKAAERHGTGKVRVVAELLEQRHASLAAATGADDFIVSDELGSLMIAQIAERHELAAVFTQLFDHDGQNIELGPVTRYGAEQARCFADVVAAASRLGHSALGYRRAVDHVVVLNPAKSASLRLVAGDEVVVLRPVPVAAPAPVPADAVPTFEDAFAALAAEHPEAAPRVMPA